MSKIPHEKQFERHDQLEWHIECYRQHMVSDYEMARHCEREIGSGRKAAVKEREDLLKSADENERCYNAAVQELAALESRLPRPGTSGHVRWRMLRS